MNACWQTGWNAHNAAVFPPWSQQLSALTDLLFLHSWIRGAHIMQKVNKQLIKVTCGWRKPPSLSTVTLLVWQSFPCISSSCHLSSPSFFSFLHLMFLFYFLWTTQSTSRNLSNLHTPSSDHMGGQSSSSLLQSIQLMLHQTLLVVEKTQRLQIPPVHLHSTWKNKQRFFHKLQPKLNYYKNLSRVPASVFCHITFHFSFLSCKQSQAGFYGVLNVPKAWTDN